MKVGFINKSELVHEYDGFYSLEKDMLYFNGKIVIKIHRILNGYIFLTDLASIPDDLKHIFPNKEKYNYPAVLHDYLYASNSLNLMNRVNADWTFLQALKSEGVSWYRRWIMFLSVRMFGRKHYRSTKWA